MSSNDQQIMQELESLLSFENENEKLKLEAELLHLKFVDVIEELMEQENITKAELAEKLSTSKSYITQLFAGDKLVNIKMLVKLQRTLNVNFTLTASGPFGSYLLPSIDMNHLLASKSINSEQEENDKDGNG